MPARPQNGFQNTFQAGGQIQGAPAQPDPQQRTAALSEWIDEVIAAGGVTADAADTTRLQSASDHLTEIITAGGTELAPDQEQLLGRVARDLRRVSQVGDSAVDGADGDYDTVLSLAEYRLEEFLDTEISLLSDEASSRLASALATIETVYADGVVSDAERTDVGSAADIVCSVLEDDFVKLSDAGLEDLEEQQADLTTLLDTGFLTLDDSQWAAINAADAALDALAASDGSSERAAAHEALDSLRSVMAGSILDLGSPLEALGLRHQSAGIGFFGA